jgi:uncharacterized membrane protein
MQNRPTQTRRSAGTEGYSSAGKNGKQTANRLLAELRRRRQSHRQRRRSFRIAFAIAGTLVLAAGMAMIVLPGPALVVLPVGLAMLALEFRWADRALHRIARQTERWHLPKWLVAGAVFVAVVVGVASVVVAI